MFSEEIYKLSTYETFTLNLNQCGDCLCLCLKFLDIDQHKVPFFNKELVIKGLEILQRRHPFLNSVLKYDKISNEYYSKFEKDLCKKDNLEWIDLTKERNPRPLISSIVEKINQKQYDLGNDLLWKVNIISFQEEGKIKYAIGFYTLLLITDGINITTVAIELVNILNCLLTNTECDEMRVVLEPVEGIHTLCEKQNIIGEKQKKFLEESFSREKPNFVLPDYFKPTNGETGFKMNVFKIDKQVSKILINLTKLNRTRFTGFFSSIAIYALRQLFIENGQEFPENFLFGIAANMRLKYNPNMDYSKMSCQVCLGEIEIYKNEFGMFKDLWKDAAYLQKLIVEASSIETGSMFVISHNEAELNAINQEFKKANNKQEVCDMFVSAKKTDLIISNIGTYVDQNIKVVRGPLIIRETYFSDSLSSKSSLFPSLVFHISSWKGELMIQLSSNKSDIASHFVDRYFELVKELIFHEAKFGVKSKL